VVFRGGQSLKPVLRGLGGNRVLTAFQGWRYDNLQGAADHGLDFPLLGVDHAEILLGPNTLVLGTDALSGVLYFTDVRPRTDGLVQSQVYAGSVLAGAQHSLHGPGGGMKPYYLGLSTALQRDYLDAHGDTVHGTAGQTHALRSLWAWEDRRQGRHKVALSATSRQLGIPEGHDEEPDSAEEHQEHQQGIQGLNLALESQWETPLGQLRSHQGYNRSVRQEREGNDVHVGFALQSLSSTTTLTRTNLAQTSTETFGFQAFAKEVRNQSIADETVYPDAQQGFLAGFYHRAQRFKQVEASAGLRGEWGNFPVWSGLARLSWTPRENSHLRQCICPAAERRTPSQCGPHQVEYGPALPKRCAQNPVDGPRGSGVF